MQNIFNEVKNFKVILTTPVEILVPTFSVPKGAFAAQDLTYLYKGKEKKVTTGINFSGEVRVEIEPKADPFAKEVMQKEFNFPSVLSTFNGKTLYRILGIGAMVKPSVPFKMAEDLNEQRYFFFKEEYNEETKEFTIFLKPKEKAERKHPNYEELLYLKKEELQVLKSSAKEQFVRS